MFHSTIFPSILYCNLYAMYMIYYILCFMLYIIPFLSLSLSYTGQRIMFRCTVFYSMSCSTIPQGTKVQFWKVYCCTATNCILTSSKKLYSTDVPCSVLQCTQCNLLHFFALSLTLGLVPLNDDPLIGMEIKVCAMCTCVFVYLDICVFVVYLHCCVSQCDWRSACV